MIVLDTNVVSELMKPEPNQSVVSWVDGQSSNDLFLTSIVVAELAHGVARLPEGKRRSTLGALVESMVAEDFAQRALAFDEVAAGHYGDMAAQRERLGRPIALADAQIAAICRSHGATLATRNVADFEHLRVKVIDPWDPLPSD